MQSKGQATVQPVQPNCIAGLEDCIACSDPMVLETTTQEVMNETMNDTTVRPKRKAQAKEKPASKRQRDSFERHPTPVHLPAQTLASSLSPGLALMPAQRRQTGIALPLFQPGK